MHTDDHILKSLAASKVPLPAIAEDLRMSFTALVKWMDDHADLVAVAKRAIESHIELLTLGSEAAALVDLIQISATTPDEERKRKCASQLLRHTAKRLLPANLPRPRANALPSRSSEAPASNVQAPDAQTPLAPLPPPPTLPTGPAPASITHPDPASMHALKAASRQLATTSRLMRSLPTNHTPEGEARSAKVASQPPIHQPPAQQPPSSVSRPAPSASAGSSTN